jgi:hypothetical protein
VWGKRQRAVFAALETIRARLPFPRLGLDSDHGSAFLTAQLVRDCAQEQLTCTRSRPSGKHDQAHVEQQHGSVVRQRIGDGRCASAVALAQLTAVYDLLRRWTHCWQPSLKLVATERDDTTGKTRKPDDTAQTPSRRRLASGVLSDAQQQGLAETLAIGGPAALRRQLATAVAQLLRVQERPNARCALDNDHNDLPAAGSADSRCHRQAAARSHRQAAARSHRQAAARSHGVMRHRSPFSHILI